jgi:hypothetical protein
MSKQSIGFVPALIRGLPWTAKLTGGEALTRSQVIEARGSSEAWDGPPRVFVDCGLAGRIF